MNPSDKKSPQGSSKTRSRRVVPSKTRARKRKPRDPRDVLYYNAKARAKRDGLPFTIKKKDLVIPSHCPILGIPLFTAKGRGGKDNSPSLDRIRGDLGYVDGNTIIISNRANRIKSDASIGELRDIASFYATLRRSVRVTGSLQETA